MSAIGSLSARPSAAATACTVERASTPSATTPTPTAPRRDGLLWWAAAYGAVPRDAGREREDTVRRRELRQAARSGDRPASDYDLRHLPDRLVWGGARRS